MSNEKRPTKNGKNGNGSKAAAGPAKASARGTFGGPARGVAKGAAPDELVAKQAGTQAMVADVPFNQNKALEHGDARPQAGGGQDASTRPPGDGQHAHRDQRLREGRQRQSAGRASTRATVRSTACASIPAAACSRPTRACRSPTTRTRSRRACAARRCSKTSSCARRSRTSTTSAFPSASCTRAAPARTATSSATSRSTRLTRASIFAEAGKRTPVFVRFSTVAGERGSTDTARDVRGFAVKFYTDEGNWDLVGNNIPVFFIQDAMKFPDLVHAVKPEPHHAMPQAASAHDTFWDFVSLMPESTHMLMWVMSDRAIPRSYRMMQGFGVHTFRFVNAAGESRFVKFHWNAGRRHAFARLGRGGQDLRRRSRLPPPRPVGSDRGRRVSRVGARRAGLHRGARPSASASTCSTRPRSFPRSWCRCSRSAAWCSNRNPDNFFAETEQVAFCTAHIVPGHRLQQRPAARRAASIRTSTRRSSRLGGPNFHEIPINAPVAQVHNNQRDGMHRQAIPRGRVAYEPNSLGGGCPFQAGTQGFMSFPQPIEEDKVRGKPEKFAEHYNQATLFWNSQTRRREGAHRPRVPLRADQGQTVGDPRAHGRDARATSPTSWRKRVADGLGHRRCPSRCRSALERARRSPRSTSSPALSLFARPGDGGITTRRIAILVADGVDGEPLTRCTRASCSAARCRASSACSSARSTSASGDPLEVEISMEAGPSVLCDAIVLPTARTP